MIGLITNTFVLVSPDCPVSTGMAPPCRGATPTVALAQYELLVAQPNAFTLEDLMFEVHLRREGLTKGEAKSLASAIKIKLFAKPYACMRASPLPKKYGWGVHHDGSGRIALYGVESAEYQRFANGKVKGVDVVVAMRNKRAR
jgi:hypothetical protein